MTIKLFKIEPDPVRSAGWGVLDWAVWGAVKDLIEDGRMRFISPAARRYLTGWKNLKLKKKEIVWARR